MMTDQIKQFITSRAPYDVKELLYSYTDMVKFAQVYSEVLNKHDRVAGVSQQRELLMAFKEWEANKCKLPWDANIDEVVEQYLVINCG